MYTTAILTISRNIENESLMREERKENYCTKVTKAAEKEEMFRGEVEFFLVVPLPSKRPGEDPRVQTISSLRQDGDCDRLRVIYPDANLKNARANHVEALACQAPSYRLK